MKGGIIDDSKQVSTDRDVLRDLIDEFVLADNKTSVFAKAERDLRGMKIPNGGLSNDSYINHRNVWNYSYIEFLERLMMIYEDNTAILAMILPRHRRIWAIHNKSI